MTTATRNGKAGHRCKIKPRGVPSWLRAQRRWIVWKYVIRNGKPDKMPCRPDGLNFPKGSAWNDPGNFLTFDEAWEAFRKNADLAGFGIVLGYGLCGYDRDDCIADDGSIDPEGLEHLRRLDTYTEVSPSGRGVKAFLRGPDRLPDGKTGRNDPSDPTEWYTGGRWFAVTGLRLDGFPADVREAGDDFEGLYRETYPALAKPKPAPRRSEAPPLRGASRYALRALVDEAEAVENAPEGTRNNRLNEAAHSLGTLVGSGALGESDVEDHLLAAALASGLDEREARRTIRNGLDAGKAKPRDLSGIGTMPRPEPKGGGNGKPPAHPAPEAPDGDNRPTVIVSAEIHETIEATVEAIRAHPAIFQRGNTLVSVARTPEGMAGRLEYREAGSPRIVPIPAPRLAELISQSVRCVKYDGRSKSHNPIRPPGWLAESIQARGEYPGIRPIEGIIEAPTVRPDGSILDAPGYDDKTGLVYIPNGKFDPVPDSPTRDDAAAAAGRLMEFVGDFPFRGDEHRAAWLAAMLTVAGRFAIPGPVPLFLFDANVPGAGKTWLADLIAIIVAGREMPRSSYSSDDAEMAKVILSVALAAVRFVLFDNVPTGFRIGGGALDRALTGRTFQDRILGKSQLSPETPLDAVFFCSGNNLGLKGDALRRIAPSRLDSPHERPEERQDFKIGDIKGYARQHRGALLADALTILRAHAVAGRPGADLTRIGYPEWSSVVRDAIHWATGFDPAAPRVELRNDDDETERRKALVGGWKAIAGSSDRAISIGDAIRKIEEKTPETEALFDLLTELSDEGKMPSSRKLGNLLARERGRPTPEGAIDFRVSAGRRLWYVRPCNHSIGDSGDSGASRFSQREKSCMIRGTTQGEFKGLGPETEPPEPPEPPEDSAPEGDAWEEFEP